MPFVVGTLVPGAGPRKAEPEAASPAPGVAVVETAEPAPETPVRPTGMRGRTRLILGGLLLLGLLLRLPGLPLLGTTDTYIWKLWAYVAATRGVTAAYPLKGRADWPPLTLSTLDQVRHGAILPGANTWNR